jgi:hypothetical protein
MLMQLSSRSRLALFHLVAIWALSSLSVASDSKVVLRGQIDPKSVQAAATADAPLTFVTTDGEKHKVAGDSMSNAQLRDSRLIDREWELEASVRPDGQFEIFKLFTIKDGKRYRVTYYCDVCHIVTHEPGDCMCCQAPTELREIPGE